MDAVKVDTYIKDIGTFSSKLEEVLRFMLLEISSLRESCKLEQTRMREDLDKRTDRLTKAIENESEGLKEMQRKSNEKMYKRFEETDEQINQGKVDLKKEIGEIKTWNEKENDKRMKEAEMLQQKMDLEKRELKEYLEKDATEMKKNLENEKMKLQDKLSSKTKELSEKIDKGNKERMEETISLAQKLEEEKNELVKEVQNGKEEIHGHLSQADERRVEECLALKLQIEQQHKAKGNEITQMFDRLKNENESRKIEIHGLKDILVRENERITKEMSDVQDQVSNDITEMRVFVDTRIGEHDQAVQSTEEDLFNALKREKKEVREKIHLEVEEMKKKIELETNVLRDQMHLDKKLRKSTMEEEKEELRRELQLMRSQMSADKDEIQGKVEANANSLVQQLEKDSNSISNMIKKETSQRELEIEILKGALEKDVKNLKLVAEGDKKELKEKMKKQEDMTMALEKEANLKRQYELKEIEESFKELGNNIKKEISTREMEIEEIIAALKKERKVAEDKTLRERQIFRDALESEYLELNDRLEKLNMQRVDDTTDIHNKLGLLGKSASRHIDNLKRYVFRECQSLFDLATKPCSIVFNCHRDDSYFNGGEDYVTFTGCSVNIGNGMNPSTGEFICPETGLYFFLLTCCTYDKKKCLLSIRKNGKDVANIFDQDGNENQGKTMLGQNVLLELTSGDKVQLYAYTASGLTDHKNSHYTQFIGMLLRPSVEAMHEFVRKLGNPDMVAEEESICRDASVSTMRGMLSGDPVSLAIRSRRNSRNSMKYSNGNANNVRVARGSSLNKEMIQQGGEGNSEGSLRSRGLSPRLMSPSFECKIPVVL